MMREMCLAIALGLGLFTLWGRAEESRQAALLRLRNSDFVYGKLLESDSPDEIHWQAEGFALPLRFSVEGVHAVKLPAVNLQPDLKGPYSFELAGGDSFHGSLVSLDQDHADVQAPVLGLVRIKRKALVRMTKVGPADLVYAGPSGLEGWKTLGPEDAWRNDAGPLQTRQPGAAIERAIQPPSLARYEIELSWSAAPNFELTFGLSETSKGRVAFRIETWGHELVATRESATEADLALLQKIPAGAGQFGFVALFDEPRGRLIVLSSAGVKLADLTVAPDQGPATPKANPWQDARRRDPTSLPEFSSGVRLVNRRGDLALRRITVSRWSGAAPEPPAADASAIGLTDGTSLSASIASFDSASRELVVNQGGEERRIAESLVQDIVWSQRMDAPSRPTSVLLATGARLSGELKKIQQQAVTLACPGIQEPLVLSMDDIQAIVRTDAETSTFYTNPASDARLELADASLRGQLVEPEVGAAGGSCLAFQPRYSRAGSPLAADISGRLVLRDPPKPPTVTQEVRTVNGRRVIIQRERIVSNYPAPITPLPPGMPERLSVLHLRSGDTLQCLIESIDEVGVTFSSSAAEASFVPHERIKAIELRPDAPAVQIEKSKFERLLTLPRMQRDNPPEHLIRSLDGDYLRGRVLAMNDKELTVEVRLEARTIDRDQVSRILWLHPDEAAKATVVKRDEPAEHVEAPSGIRVQAAPRTGNRLTFYAQKLSGKTLSGTSDILGACKVELDKIDQLLLGSKIEDAASTLAFHQWKLRAAAEPLPDAESGADPNNSAGMESVLVGKDAPAVELDLLDGKSFKLANLKGNVVILDFWASWCGPCLQAMPQVDAVAHEFAEQGVQLVAINLEEAPEQIKSALSRLKLETTVALDKDGRVAERYGATSIPQTVIIDREGKVARLFVGASARFDEQLRAALRAVLSGAPGGDSK